MKHYDRLLVEIADYALNGQIESDEALRIARYVLMDSIGSALLALRFPECTKLLGPIVPEIHVSNGCRVPGTSFELDPVQGAFNIGTMVRWLDYNDTWLAAEWGHPSDNLGAILAVADYLSRSRVSEGRVSLKMKDVLQAMIKAHEIQGILALENSLNRQGLDHVLFVKIASTAVVTAMLGGDQEQVVNALSQAWCDGGTLRAYRHAPNTGSRKSWAAGDATSRAVRLAYMSMRGEMGYPTVLSAKKWGFQDVFMQGKELVLGRPLSSYVMENILFKNAFPAEFHAQTAVECAFQLHSQIKERSLNEIASITLSTHESAIRIIDKKGPLNNPADRDHCLQYMVAIGLLYGELTAEHYEDEMAKDPRIDLLRSKMIVKEDKQYSQDYLDPDKRSIANALQINYVDGSQSKKVICEYPLGHRKRRSEGLPRVVEKFKANIATRFPQKQTERLVQLSLDESRLLETSVVDYMKLWVI